MQKRYLNVSYNKAGSGSTAARVILPKKWVDEMGLTEDAREVVAEFDGTEIKLRKMSDAEKLKKKIEKLINEEALKTGAMGTESVTVYIELTEMEKEVFAEMDTFDSPHYWWEFEGLRLTISYCEDV